RRVVRQGDRPPAARDDGLGVVRPERVPRIGGIAARLLGIEGDAHERAAFANLVHAALLDPGTVRGQEERMSPMEIALAEARLAATRGEVPVGAVVIGPDGDVLARAGNAVETAH